MRACTHTYLSRWLIVQQCSARQLSNSRGECIWPTPLHRPPRRKFQREFFVAPFPPSILLHRYVVNAVYRCMHSTCVALFSVVSSMIDAWSRRCYSVHAGITYAELYCQTCVKAGMLRVVYTQTLRTTVYTSANSASSGSCVCKDST
jgi:hypothetical protein